MCNCPLTVLCTCQRESKEPKNKMIKALKAHKHCAVIKAWADGAEIQVKLNGRWTNTLYPDFTASEYRIKPEPKSLGQVLFESWYKNLDYSWDNAPTVSRSSWERAAEAVVAAYKERS